MDVQMYLQVMNCLHQEILQYIDANEGIEELNQFIINNKITENKFLFIDTLYLISSISDNHHRDKNFLKKIINILLLFKNKFQSLSEIEIFNIFKSNKRILLFLFDEKIISSNETISKTLSQSKYKSYKNYFQSEIKFNEISKLPFFDFGTTFLNFGLLNDSYEAIDYNEIYDTIYKMHQYKDINAYIHEKCLNKDKEGSDNIEDFEEKRRIGENESYMTSLIREDLIVEFIRYITQKAVSINSLIKPSNYETNSFLYDKDVSMIQYAAFFGSIQIFKYLFVNYAQYDSSLWLFAIHGNNSEIIHHLEENKINPPDNNYYQLYLESIKCHHNNLVSYIEQNYLSDETLEEKKHEIYLMILKSRNFQLFDKDLCQNTELFAEFCKYGYYFFVKSLINEKVDKINKGLNSAILHRKKEIYELLIKLSNVNLNVKSSSYKNKDKIERTALICAIEIGDLNAFKLLLSHPEIDVNESRLLNYDSEYEVIYNKEKMCPLAMTILSRNFEMFQLLCNHPSIDINQECEREFGNIQHCDIETCKYSPLFLTVDFQLNEYLIVMLENPKIDVNSHYIFKNRFIDSSCFKISAANFALKRKNKEMAHFIMKHPKYDINAISIQNNKEENLLYLAYQSNDLDTFKLLLTMDNIDMNIVLKTSINPLKETTILQDAFKHWKVDFIKTLLEHPKTIVNLNINEEFDIKKVPNCLKKYKNKGNTETILHYAIEKGDIDIIRLILTHKNVDINSLS